MAKSIPSTIKLASGYEIPRLGFGVYQTPPEDAERCCLEAFKAGYRHIDSASGYKNEAGCGSAILKSGLPRSEIFFTSKVLKINYNDAKATVDKTLSETKLDYIDLMLLHQPYGGSEGRKGAWKALVEAVEAGKVRSIGVSNYGVHHLNELEQHMCELEAERGQGKGGVLSINQVEVHPWLARRDIVDWCHARGVFVEAYCPIVRGARFDEPVLQKLAKKYGKEPAQVLIAGVYDFALTEEEVQELETDEYSPVAWDPTVAKLEE
ncbi:oxidoreductase [Penicillium chermesinum]|uniref:D-xylose reductase [NAD(P)H] n=1 Tax=Penicillium chermesinum TaxID=63820 RepID=A0A9W9TYW9_9EURO|nr:oxidoreductase [Penicillium chermesinum]KAJ5246729.1 oxidoreductase [Penicillium chermesinum]